MFIYICYLPIQIVIAQPHEDWQSAIAACNDEATPLHLLQPTNLVIQIHKCLITDDPRMPKIRVRGELQKIAISASEDRLVKERNVIKLSLYLSLVYQKMPPFCLL